MRGASRTDATGQRSVHVDDGGGLRAGDAEPRELVAEQQPELLQRRQLRQLERVRIEMVNMCSICKVQV